MFLEPEAQHLAARRAIPVFILQGFVSEIVKLLHREQVITKAIPL